MIDEQIKICYIYTDLLEYILYRESVCVYITVYLVYILQYAHTQWDIIQHKKRNLAICNKGIMLSEIRQTEKNKYHIMSLVCRHLKTK